MSLVAELELVAWRDGFPMTDQPRIVTRPQPGSTRDAFLGSIAGELFDHSNAYLWLPATGRNAAGYPDTAVVLPFDDVAVSWDESGLFRRYRWGERDLVPGRDLVHVELPGRRPGELLVPSKFDTNADALDRILAAELYAADWFSNGAVPSVVLKFAGPMNGQDAKDAKAQWIANHVDHSPGVVGAGLGRAGVRRQPRELAAPRDAPRRGARGRAHLGDRPGRAPPRRARRARRSRIRTSRRCSTRSFA